MDRRNWLLLTTATLLGCKGKLPPAPASAATTLIKAGAFAVTVPAAWSATAVVERVPMRPLYTAEEWKILHSDTPSDLPLAIHKPDYGNRPRHWAVRLPAATPAGIPIDLASAGDDPTAAQILIHKADEWAMVLADGIHPDPKNSDLLRKLRDDMKVALTREDNWHLSPAFMDASLTPTCLKKRLDFDGGHGIRLIAQWNIEPDLIRKGRLHYLFLGMSEDDTCQIIATFPVNLPGLPDVGPEAGHLGRSMERYEELSKDLDAYERAATAWLEQHAAELSPSLDVLDDMMRSLVVRHWE